MNTDPNDCVCTLPDTFTNHVIVVVGGVGTLSAEFLLFLFLLHGCFHRIGLKLDSGINFFIDDGRVCFQGHVVVHLLDVLCVCLPHFLPLHGLLPDPHLLLRRLGIHNVLGLVLDLDFYVLALGNLTAFRREGLRPVSRVAGHLRLGF